MAILVKYNFTNVVLLDHDSILDFQPTTNLSFYFISKILKRISSLFLDEKHITTVFAIF